MPKPDQANAASIRGVAAMLALLLISACAPTQPEFGECKPGVSDLGRTTTITPRC
jgi:hypothetical protein